MISKKHFSIVIGVLIVGLIVGSFFDYQISTALYSKNNGFGIFFAAFGEWPGYAMLAFLGGYTFMLALKYYRKNIGGIGLMAGGVVAFGCASFFLGKAIFSINAYNHPENTIFPGLLIGAGLMVPPLAAGIFFGNKVQNKELWKISLFVLLAIAAAIGAITVIKHIPHRPRFRLVTSNSDVDFYPWFRIFKDYDNCVSAGINKEEFKSFPSGHVGISSAIFMSVYIPMLLEMKNPKKLKSIFFYVSCAYILLLAYTRILVGAHYLSDVSAGGIIPLAIFMVLIFILDKDAKKFEEQQTQQAE